MAKFQKFGVWVMAIVLTTSLASCGMKDSSSLEQISSEDPVSSQEPPATSGEPQPPQSDAAGDQESSSKEPEVSLPPLNVDDMKPFDDEKPKARDKAIALTFDDGPGAKTTRRLIEALNERGARATFFVLGSRVNAYPDIVKYAYESGHQIGNHSYDHKTLTKLPQAEMLKQISDTDDAVKKVTGYITSYIRPPGGAHDETIDSRMGRPIITWSIDPKDWKVKNADKVYNTVISKVKDGDIVLFHDIYSTSVDAAIRVVDTLSRQGYSFVTLDELFAIKGQTPKAGHTYNGLHYPNVQ